MVRLLLLFSISCLLLACDTTPPKPVIQLKDLEGHWEVTKATRNGRPTESLDGAFFTFLSDGSVTSNLLGDTMTVSYSLKEDTIYQEFNTPIIYLIQEIEIPVMVVKTTLRSTPFQFYLEKK